jgi:hypothetical protein
MQLTCQKGAGMSASPGHKRLERLLEAEAYRRIMAGEAPATLGEFAQQLLDWLRASHPDAPPMTLTAIEQRIRETWDRRHELIRGGDL